eukprot:TRINITY_DN71539_c0_g1_i1.p1 TRINITY_DN71539_c0_g1~~TRINITY_DN71539_c0_g1_i1.p1  ORF type:complete len:501 (+),score=118.47 TRINITY_DN71539_c0_g1_i1:143-1645(+)
MTPSPMRRSSLTSPSRRSSGMGMSPRSPSQRSSLRSSIRRQAAAVEPPPKGKWACCIRISRWVKKKNAQHELAAIHGEGHWLPCVRKIVMSNVFEWTMSTVILLNCVVIGWQVELPLSEKNNVLSQIFEHFFVIMFLLELILRLLYRNWTMLIQSEYFLDIFLVILGTTSLIARYAGVELDILRKMTVLRTLRLTRLGRAVKHREEFQVMWQLLKGLMDSSEILFWSFVMIFSTLYVFAIVFTTMVARQPLFADDELVQEHFGDVLLSIITLFQIMTLDSWTGLSRPIAEKAGWVSWLFIFFISVAAIVLMNLVVAVIVENAFDTANEEDSALQARMQLQKAQELEELEKVFVEIDQDGSGTITREELAACAKQRKVRKRLQAFGVMKGELAEMFDLCDDGDGELEAKEFVNGLRAMQGEASAKDFCRLQGAVYRMRNSANSIEHTLQNSEHRLGDIRRQLRKVSMDIEALKRTMALAKNFARGASKTQPLGPTAVLKKY